MTSQVHFDDILPLKRIAGGSYGTVVLCKHLSSQLVLKLVDKNRLDTTERIARIETEWRVLREVSCTSQFLVSGLGCYQTHNAVMFALEYCERGDLLFYFQKRPGQYGETGRNRLLLMQIAQGIQALHEFGVVWRDAKMENILIGQDGRLKLCDFGLAKFLTPRSCCPPTPTPTPTPTDSFIRSLSHSSLLSYFSHNSASSSTNTSMLEQEEEVWETTRTRYCGTSYYLSPQSVSGKAYGLEHDWWGFGVLVYEMLCGRLPFYSPDSTKHTYAAIMRNRPRMRQFKHATTKQFVSQLLTSLRTKRLGFGPNAFRKIQSHAFFAKEVSTAGGNWDRAVEQTPLRFPPIEACFDPSQCEFDTFTGSGRPDLIIDGVECISEANFQRLREQVRGVVMV
ncbi:hypothetical protein BASA81_013834 [Batrachochytrium salamandrivorans]|nr:hypothetical protein BASA81_013834 [Batrachochytrium salamandrivorans]